MFTFDTNTSLSKVYNYREYADIPPHMQDYIRSVAQVDDIRDLFLHDVNDFLNGLIEWEEEQA
jgi:hypothetical protein